MATHSSVLAWRIPGMAEPGVLPSMGSHRVGHDWSDLAAAAAGQRWVFLSSGTKRNSYKNFFNQFNSMQSLSSVQLFVTPWTAACQASLSITNSRSLLKLMSMKSVMPSNHLILCCPLLLQSFPASVSFSISQFFTVGGQSIRVSASPSVLLMDIQDWFPLGLTGWISLQSKGLSRVFSNKTVQKHQFFSTQLFL